MNKNLYNFFWYRGKYFNFGDEIVPWLVEKITNHKIDRPCELTEKNILLSLGSVIKLANKNTTIWGTGIMRLSEQINQPKYIHSVRGHFSRQRLLSLGIDCPNFFGDPALIVKNYYDPETSVQYELGIIPHVVDFGKAYSQYQNIENIKIIDLKTNNIEKVILDVKSCKKIITSSLHGLIISILYDRPTRWVKFSDKLFGDNIKFYDFFSSIDPSIITGFDYKNIKSDNKHYNCLPLYDNICLSLIHI